MPSPVPLMAERSPLWEGIFGLENFIRLRLPEQVDVESVYLFLTRQIRRRPTLLSLHLCRIRAAALMDEGALYAALLDLFWVLEEKGYRLRRRMLHRARKWLSEEHSCVLQQCLSGRIPSRRLPFSPRSVLHDGRWGVGEDLIQAADDASEALDPVTVARLCLEAGQIEQARDILASQLHVEPERAEARQDLLEIYRATQDAAGFWQSYRWLEANSCLDEAWQAAGVWFAKEMI